jgi:4-hydroxybenzoate polyprenyltransferase
MDSYNKRSLNIAGVITALSILLVFGGWWLTHNYLFITIGCFIMGCNLFYFSRDLAIERVVKYKLNYKFARGMYILASLVFILVSIFWLVKGQ